MEIEKLDNPVYNSLKETHKDLVIDYSGMKFYHPDFCPFGGFVNEDNSETGIEAYSKLIDNFYVVGNKPNFNKKVKLNRELVCKQMILDKPNSIESTEQITEFQTAKERADLFNLVNLVQPGYFKKKTSEMGNYYGIYKDNQLAAVTGERMKMNNYTEVSAVVTHPKHIRKGYAKQLVNFTCSKIFEEGKIPYLHVANTNVSAIKLYEKLGFRTRRHISFWNFVSNNTNLIIRCYIKI